MPYTRASWLGRMRASARLRARPDLDAETVMRREAALGRWLVAQCPVEPFPVPHRIFAVVAAAPR